MPPLMFSVFLITTGSVVVLAVLYWLIALLALAVRKTFAPRSAVKFERDGKGPSVGEGAAMFVICEAAGTGDGGTDAETDAARRF